MAKFCGSLELPEVGLPTSSKPAEASLGGPRPDALRGAGRRPAVRRAGWRTRGRVLPLGLQGTALPYESIRLGSQAGSRGLAVGIRGSGAGVAAAVRARTRAKRPVNHARSRSEACAAACKAVSRARSAAIAARRLAEFEEENSMSGSTARWKQSWCSLSVVAPTRWPRSRATATWPTARSHGTGTGPILKPAALGVRGKLQSGLSCTQHARRASHPAPPPPP